MKNRAYTASTLTLNSYSMGCTNCNFKKISSADANATFSNIFGCSTSYDWLEDLPDAHHVSDIIEVRFKNNRKNFFRNTNQLKLMYNSLVTVQVTRGFDVGIVSLKGLLAQKQFLKKSLNTDTHSLGIIFRKATESDIKSWEQGKAREKEALVTTRKIVSGLSLDMKISDVEFQGDQKKITFYYIAASRVDFRELIKILAGEFGVNIEMRQIGARQEAAKIGGIGSCGKELCCSSWRTRLDTVSSKAIPSQQLASNIEKYTGQCGKLKCCLMYELATYLDAKADFPKELLELETPKGIAYPAQIDVLQKKIWYTFKTPVPEPLVEVSLERVIEVIRLNKQGVKVDIIT